MRNTLYRVAQKIGTIFVRLNFTNYSTIFRIISLSESVENW